MAENNESHQEIEKLSAQQAVELFDLYTEANARIGKHLEEVREYEPDTDTGKYMAWSKIYSKSHSSHTAPFVASIAPIFLLIGTLLGVSGFGLGWLIFPAISPFVVRAVERKYGIYGELFTIDYAKKRKKGSRFRNIMTKFFMTKEQRAILHSLQQEREEYDTAVELYNLLVQKSRIELADDLETVNRFLIRKGQYAEISDRAFQTSYELPAQEVKPVKSKNLELSESILSRLYENPNDSQR